MFAFYNVNIGMKNTGMGSHLVCTASIYHFLLRIGAAY